MPGGTAFRAFKPNKENPNTSRDYTNLKRNETLFESISKNARISNALLKQNGETYKDTVLIDTSGCLVSIGGYNVSNYELYLEISKGKYSLHRRKTQKNQDNIFPNLNYKISEGPFFIHDSSFNPCNEESALRDNFKFNPAHQLQYPIKNLTLFKFPQKIKIKKII